MPSRPEPRPALLAVDRIACTGHGVCAHLLPRQVTLDEWGYPILASSSNPTGAAGTADTATLEAAVTLCPARALYLRPAGR